MDIYIKIDVICVVTYLLFIVLYCIVICMICCTLYICFYLIGTQYLIMSATEGHQGFNP